MKALRILKLYGQSSSNTYLDFPTALEPVSDKLRIFHFDVSHVHELDKLKRIDLSECKQIEELPNLSKASGLKWVNLSGCENLRDLHPSVLSADTLVTLILDRCTRLRRVKGIQTLDLSIGNLNNLKQLNLEGLRLKHLPNGLSHLRSLKELRIPGSGLIVGKQQLHVLFDGLRKLQGASMSARAELPPVIKQLYAVNYTLLVLVSNLKTLATKMMGKAKHISFKADYY
ncbi:Leucine-rich repeat domain superfamily [Sesbania bispinosa]|nr:Leucine-rich repeat domain superfamily [Sesbania bispinosa]